MGRFGTREDEVDDLFRLGVFVDLYRSYDKVSAQASRAIPSSGSNRWSATPVRSICDSATKHLIEFEAALDDGVRVGGSGPRRRRRLQRRRLPGDLCPPGLVGTTTGSIWRHPWGRRAAARPGRRQRNDTEDPELTRLKQVLLPASPDPEERSDRAGSQKLAGGPARVASPRGEASMVAILPGPRDVERPNS